MTHQRKTRSDQAQSFQRLDKSAPRGGPLRQRLAAVFSLSIWKDTGGQDMMEYALIAALITVAAVALVPSISVSISTIFSKIASTTSAAANTS
jgi:pilus assembly protein Flp/PilA